MLRGGWRYFFAIGLSVVVALGLAAAIYRSAEQSEALYRYQAEKHAQAARDSGPMHARRVCDIVPLSKRAECQADEYNEARARELQEYDLEAQLVTSTWTRAMGLAALVGMIVGVVGVGLIYTTFRENKRSVDSLLAAEGARVVLKRAETKIGRERGGLVFNLAVVNLGRTNAVITQVDLWRASEPDFFEDPQGERIHEHGGPIVTSNEVANLGPYRMPGNLKDKPYILGELAYLTVFPGERHTLHVMLRLKRWDRSSNAYVWEGTRARGLHEYHSRNRRKPWPPPKR